MTTISIINQKGGVGKSTTAINLSAGLAQAGHETLLIDLDPQANATYGLGIDLDELDRVNLTIAQALDGETTSLGDTIIKTRQERLKLAPADIKLARTAAIIHSKNFRESILRKAISDINGGFDFIIIDCQPSLDVLPINAMVASDKLIIPTELSGYALKGFTDLIYAIGHINNSAKAGGDQLDYRILLTKVSGTFNYETLMAEIETEESGGAGVEVTSNGEPARRITKKAQRYKQALRFLHPVRDFILKSAIRNTESIERSQTEMDDGEVPLTPVVMQTNDSAGRRDYRSLTKEVIGLWH